MANVILTKNSTTADNVPSTSECVVSEVGANTTDGKLYLGTDLAEAGSSSPGDTSTEVSWVGAVIKDEDNMASNSDDALATQQSIKAYADTMLPLAGGTMTGDIVLPVAASEPASTGAEGEIRLSAVSSRGSYTFKLHIYLQGGWRSEQLT